MLSGLNIRKQKKTMQTSVSKLFYSKGRRVIDRCHMTDQKVVVFLGGLFCFSEFKLGVSFTCAVAIVQECGSCRHTLL